MVDIEQGRMVGVEILAYVGMDAGGTFALVAKVKVLAMHGVHIGRRTSEVTQIALEVGQLRDGFDFLENALLAP